MLMAERGTPPAKGRGPRHQQTKSATNASVFDNPSPHSNPKQRNNHRGHHGRHQPNSQPAWDLPVTAIAGDFDAEGKYVESGAETTTEAEEVVYAGRKNNGQKKKNRAVSSNVSYATSPGPNGKPVSPRHLSGQQGQQPVHVAPQAATATPVKAAYAGPAFHASPAPSSIPIPKFFSKSVPNSTSQPSLRARLEQEQSNDGKKDSPPSDVVSPPLPVAASAQPRREESPLDFFFKADREEKEKSRSSSGLGQSLTPKSKPPPVAFQTEPAPQRTWAEIYGTGPRKHERHASSGGVFTMDMDGDSANRDSNVPAMSPGAYNGNQRGVASPMHSGSAPQDKASQLKDYLNSIPVQVHSPVQSTPPHVSSAPEGFHTPSPFYQPGSQSRSGITAALNQGQGRSNPPLHYGNRNLSPLFKAAKNGNGRSNLRQELDQPSQGPLNAPTGPKASRNRNASNKPKEYLNKVPYNASPAQGPQSMAPVEAPASPLSRSSGNETPISVTAPAKDMKSMEDDLRRMLNLGGAPVR